MESLWYRNHNLLTLSLVPASWIFRSLVLLRRMFYRKKSVQFDVPVIVVGNITVGGTGKTPCVIWLARFLQTQGFKPGIVSRGVGGKQSKTPRWVTHKSFPHIVGDEALLLLKKSGCPIVVGIDRVRAVKELLAESDCNIVISDDGLQHYRLGRDIEIAMVDGMRGLGNKSFLPAGPLRESPKRLKEVDFVLEQVTHPCSTQYTHFGVQLIGDELVSVKRFKEKKLLNTFSKQKVHAVAAIGNPKRFFNRLREAGIEIIEHVYPDHYLYKSRDFNFGDNLPILMTEKDMVKCANFADDRFWYLPVEMQVKETFQKALLDKIHLTIDKRKRLCIQKSLQS